MRWKRDSSGKKVIRDGKPVLEFVAIERRDCSEWALPGVSQLTFKGGRCGIDNEQFLFPLRDSRAKRNSSEHKNRKPRGNVTHT